MGFYNAILPSGPSKETESASEEAAPAAGEEAAPEVSQETPASSASTIPASDVAAPQKNSTGEAQESSARRATVPPIFFDSTVVESSSKPPQAGDPPVADDHLDVSLTDLSDSHVINLSETEAELQGEPLASVAVEPVEGQDAPASVEHAELRYSNDFDDTLEEHDHLEGHDAIEPATAEARLLPESIQHHSHMRLTPRHQDEAHSGEDSDVELFEPEEPVSPFGN